MSMKPKRVGEGRVFRGSQPHLRADLRLTHPLEIEQSIPGQLVALPGEPRTFVENRKHAPKAF